MSGKYASVVTPCLPDSTGFSGALLGYAGRNTVGVKAEKRFDILERRKKKKKEGHERIMERMIGNRKKRRKKNLWRES